MTVMRGKGERLGTGNDTRRWEFVEIRQGQIDDVMLASTDLDIAIGSVRLNIWMHACMCMDWISSDWISSDPLHSTMFTYSEWG